MRHAHAAPEGAGRFDHTHGDEDGRWITAQESARIDTMADQKLAERLYNDEAQFTDLLAGIEPTDYYAQLQRALRERERAIKGDKIASDAVFTALTLIDRLFRHGAEKVWLGELKDEATTEVLGVEA